MQDTTLAPVAFDSKNNVWHVLDDLLNVLTVISASVVQARCARFSAGSSKDPFDIDNRAAKMLDEALALDGNDPMLPMLQDAAKRLLNVCSR